VCFLHKEKLPQTQEAYDKLNSWFSLHNEHYQNVFNRLVKFFEYHNCSHKEDCANETIDRAARNRDADKVNESDHPLPYCLGVARFVRNEYHRCKFNLVKPSPDPPDPTPEGIKAIEEENTDEKFACMQKCFQELDLEERNLMIAYESTKGEIKKKLARAAMSLVMGISINALRLKVSKIRKRLNKCLEVCLQKTKAT